MACFSWFSFIRAHNHAPFGLLDSLFIKEYFVKFENFYQLVEPVENRFNRFCLAASILETHQIVSIESIGNRFN